MSRRARLKRIVNSVLTPAFVIDKKTVMQRLDTVDFIEKQTGASILYTLKPLSHIEVMRWMKNRHINGFAASSLFEAQLAREILGKHGGVHITSPGLRLDEIEEISKHCDYITFNSLSQCAHLRKGIPNDVRCGLRVNPTLSFVEDKRYDPCRKRSKLGIPINELAASLKQHPSPMKGISGIHFHSNCNSTSFFPLLKTVQYLCKHLNELLNNIEWINLGGGYLLNEQTNYTPLFKAIDLLQSQYSLNVFLEPGAALVKDSGAIVSSVVDLFTHNNTSFAVLDTTVNHMPEVYEYQFQPELLEGENRRIGNNKKHKHFLVGSSCLAGDFFGSYYFDKPLKIGSRVTFVECGDYTLVKAHMFNGINLPSQYVINEENKLLMKKQYTYQDFKSRCGE